MDPAADTAEANERWLEWRKAGFGGSDIAAAYSGRYGGAYKVVADKLGIRVDADQIDPELAKRGHDWEQPIADAVHALTGLYVAGEQAWLEHPEQPRWRATVDGLLIPGPEGSFDDVVAGLELKTRQPVAPWAWDYWTAQSQWGCLVAGLPRWLLAIATIDEKFDPATGTIIPELDVRCRWVWADAFEQAQLIELAERLADLVDTGRLPEPTDAQALPYVKAANADADPAAAADIDDLAELLARYQQLKDAAKAAAEEAATVEAVIRVRMGEATEALTSDGRWRVRVGKPIARFTSDSEADALELYPDYGKTVLDRARFKKHRPDDYDDLRRPTTDRRLTIRDLED